MKESEKAAKCTTEVRESRVTSRKGGGDTKFKEKGGMKRKWTDSLETRTGAVWKDRKCVVGGDGKYLFVVRFLDLKGRFGVTVIQLIDQQEELQVFVRAQRKMMGFI